MPEIEHFQDNGDVSLAAANVAVLLSGVEAGHMLIASYVTYFTRATGPNFAAIETWVAFNAAAGNTTITAAAAGGGVQANAINIAEFIVPSNLVLFNQAGFYELVNGTPRNAYGPVISLPSNGLLWSAAQIENAATPLEDGFTELQFQTTTGISLRTAYAIGPQPGINRHGYSLSISDTDFVPTLTGLIIPEVGLRPKQIAGRGASW